MAKTPAAKVMMKVPITRPWTGEEEKKALTEVLDSGWLTQGPKVTAFEQAVAHFTGAAHAVAFSSATTALHAALLGHGIQPGEEVLVPSYTWIATPNVVRMAGAKPVFADIEIETFNVSVRTLEAARTKKTKAVLVVDQFGLPADMAAICQWAENKNLLVIEDAACALGSRTRGKPVGSGAHTACFSFHPRKLISTGEGGMLVTPDPKIAQRARVLLNHGATVSDLAKHQAGKVEALLAEEFHELGYNYRMTNFQGALGEVQMQRLPEILKRRKMRAARYSETLQSANAIIPPQVPEGAEPNWQSYAVRIRKDAPRTRNAIAQILLDAGIACRPAYMACHHQRLYQSSLIKLPATEEALETVLLLPLYPLMTDAEQAHVIETLLGAVTP